MNLIGTARALDDQRLKWRVMAACLIYAAQNAIPLPTGNTKNYALTVLMTPLTLDVSMLAFVATDNAVADAIIVDEHGVMNTEAVNDADIVRVVTDKWDEVATKYSRNPLLPTPQNQNV